MKRTTAAVATALLGLTASSAQAIDPVLVGSDTLESIMDNLIASYPLTNITDYGPVGSGGGENAIEADQQEIAPMSRFLTNIAGDPNGCGDASRDPAYAGCWSIAKDSLTLVAAPTPACDVLRWGENLTVTDANGVGGVVCPGCSPGTNTHPFADWRSVLRIIYAGQEVDGTNSSDPIATRCNSDVRLTLVNNWSNLFKGGCASGACTGGLKHAFRRDDQSGTTGVFLELLALPTISSTSGGVTTQNRPFCNGTETEDQDPVRRACAGDGALGIAGAQQGETVCGFGATPNVRGPQGQIQAAGGGSLGLVVPTLIPPAPFNQTAVAQNCSAIGAGINPNSGGGAFGRVAWGSADIVKYGPLCPNGAPTQAGTCLWPKPPGSTATSPTFGCIANKNSRPLNTPAGSTFDGRIYNLWSRNNDGTVKTYTRGASTLAQNTSMYRYRTHQCRQDDETNQIGCLAQNDTCTIGFAGFRATEVWTVKGLQLRTAAGGASAGPLDVTNYPLARDLYICQLDNPGSSVGTQSAGFVANQQTIYNDLLNNVHTRIDPAVSNGGFFTIPTFSKRCCSGTYNAGTGLCQ